MFGRYPVEGLSDERGPQDESLRLHLAALDQLTDDERATITNVIDALITKSKLRAITGDAG